MLQEPPDSYLVVFNDEEQFSIWPADQPVPTGWQAAGRSGTRESCLSYISEVWVDMRPRSLREATRDG
ncbi:MAG TPA: MbtH family NRPS accessory protein [Jatrophihabitans sp.]|nr:MbtH family NRPS accessory protein [Jatrophihabitans sp.]